MIKRSTGLYQEFPRKGGDAPRATHYCAGCGHGIILKLIGEAMADLGIQDDTVFVGPVGCATFCYYYYDCGHISAPHGRASAVATGLSRVLPDKPIIAYQGDGDLGAIGFNNAFQAANRGENFALFFVNNAVFAMTGGQMAPTTLIGQKATTSPLGRDPVEAGMGYPIRVGELLATLDGTAYIARGSVHNAANVRKTRNYIRKALELQMSGVGFTMVEILSQCPTGWSLDPDQSVDWLERNMIPVFPLGEIKKPVAEPEALPAAAKLNSGDEAKLGAA